MATVLDYDIKFLPGVGEKRAGVLARELGIRTFGDLLYYFPFRYVDRTKLFRIGDIGPDAPAYIQVRARVTGMAYEGEGRKRRLRVFVSDGSGTADLHSRFGVVQRYEVDRETHRGGARIHRFRAASTVPRRTLLRPSGNRPRRSVGEPAGRWVAGSIQHYREALRCPARFQGDLQARLQSVRLGQAEYRLKFEELLGIQLAILSRRVTRTTAADGFFFPRVGEFFNGFYRTKLPFELTGAQKRVVKEIRADTVTGHQMNRLLQGDVGSGKTLVALMAMLLAADNGFQACMMVPTEILARQHFVSITKMVEGVGVRVAVLTGSTKKRERDGILEELASGGLHILIGRRAPARP